MTQSTSTGARVDRKDQEEALSAMYSNQVGVNFGKGLADPFIPVLAMNSLGATTAQLGWLQAVINLFPAVMQVPWGKLSDFMGRRVPFLVIGGVVSFILYFFMVGVLDPWQLILLVSIQLAVGSMMIPTWSALVGDRTNPRERGFVMSKFFAVSALASLIATLVAGVLADSFVSETEEVTDKAVFAFPFFMAGISGILGSLMILRVKEQKRQMYASPRRMFAFGIKSFIFTSDLTENKYFRNLVVLNTSFNFLMSIIWPILYYTYFKVLHMTLTEYAISNVISTGATLFFQTKVGKLLDLIGPMPQILISRFAFISVPVVYAFATQPWHIYALNAALGFASAMANVAFFAYILDVAPEEKKAEYFAVYNTMIGIGTFVGSILGGYLAFYFLERYGNDLFLGLGAVYLLSAFGRAACAMWFFKLKDPVKYPETLMGVTKKTLKRWKESVLSPF
jgi:MFS family permease